MSLQAATPERRSADDDGPPLARTLGYALAGFLVLAGLAGLAGRAAGLERLAAPLSTWPPVSPLTSIALVGLGLGLLGYLRGNRSLALLASTVTGGIGTAALLSYAHLFPLPGEGVALASAFLLTTGALALVLASLPGRPEAEVSYLGIAGFILFSLPTTLVVERAAGVANPLTDPAVAGVSVQVVVGSFFLGICFLSLIRTRRAVNALAPWLAAAFGIASILTVITLWRVLTARENDQVLIQTRQAAEAERRVLNREMEATAGSLRRAADRRINGASPEQRDLDLRALERDLPVLEAGLWLSSGEAPPEKHPPATLNTPTIPGLDSVWHNYLRGNGGLPDTVAYLPLDHASYRFTILAPGCQNLRCEGAMAGVVASALLFRDTFSDTTRGFHFGIAGAEGSLEGSPTPASAGTRWVQALPLNFGTVPLTLRVWPTRSMLERVRSNLPDLVLVLGLVVSGLLPLTIHLGQCAQRNAREIERARLAAALERATDGIWEWDLITDATAESAGIWRYLGYDPLDRVPTRTAWTSLIHPDDRQRVAQALKQHLSGEAPSFEAEYRVRSKSGEWHTIVDRGRVVDHTPSGQPMRILGISADVTEIRQAEEARETTERKFRAVFDSGFQFQLLLDAGGLVLEVNRIALEEGGASSSSVRGRPVWETLWWAGDTLAQERLRLAFTAALGGTSPQYEDEIRAPDGPVTILEITLKPVLHAGGQPSQLLLEARDITVRRRAEAALQEVDTLTTMGRVAARVAHEINNPLAGIQNAFLLIKGAVPTTHPHYAYVGAIEREIARIAKVTRQLYETSRPEQ